MIVKLSQTCREFLSNSFECVNIPSTLFPQLDACSFGEKFCKVTESNCHTSDNFYVVHPKGNFACLFKNEGFNKVATDYKYTSKTLFSNTI